MEWNRGGINEWLNAWPPPGPYQPTLVTDRGSAFIGRLDRLEHSVRVQRIADFVSAVGATFAVLSFSAQTDRRESSFGVAGTDGIVACESVLPVKLKRFGRPERDDWISETYDDPHDFSPLLAPIAATIRAKGRRLINDLDKLGSTGSSPVPPAEIGFEPRTACCQNWREFCTHFVSI